MDNDAKSVLNANYSGEGESFLFYLHERDVFDKNKFEELRKSISSLAKRKIKSKEEAEQIVRVYSQTLLHLIYHFNPDDECKLRGVPEDFYGDLQELEFAVREYFS